MSAPVQESAIVTASRGLAATALKHQAIGDSEALLPLILEHPPIKSDEEAVALVDAAKACKLGADILKRQLATIVDPLKEARKAAESLVERPLAQRAAAVERAKRLVEDWKNEKIRRQRAEEERLRRIEQEAERKRRAEQRAREDEAERARLAGLPAPEVEPEEDIAPAAVVAPVAPERDIKGGIGGMTTTRRRTVEVVDQARAVAAHPELFTITLRLADAKDAFERALARDPDATLEGLKYTWAESQALR